MTHGPGLGGNKNVAAAHLDDMVIFSLTWEDHMHHVGEILWRLQWAGLTVQPKKCSLAQQEAKYLGYLLSRCVI